MLQQTDYSRRPELFGGAAPGLAEMRAVTVLLNNLACGERDVLDRVFPLLYQELRRLADGFLRRERPGHTLQATALVNEFYARIHSQDHPDYRSRAHFLGIAARVMRQILIDHARVKYAARRGGKAAKSSLDDELNVACGRSAEIVAVDEALRELELHDQLKARLIEMRFFGGMTAEESAEALQLPVTTVRSQLRLAQAWLQRELNQRCAG